MKSTYLPTQVHQGKLILKRFVLVTVLSVVLFPFFRYLDYNRLISVPFWTVWSFCYLFPDMNWSQCQEEKLWNLNVWTKNHWRWDLETQKPGRIYTIPEMSVEEFSYKALEKLSEGFTVPVVVRGLFNGSRATKTWTHEFFEERYGENILITLQEGRPEKQYRTADSFRGSTGVERASRGKGMQNIMKPSKMKLKNALKHMREGEKLYISNVDTIFRRNNELLDDLELGSMKWVYGPYLPYAAQLFLGYGSANLSDTVGSLMHCAASANLYIQVAGKKQWTMIKPRYGLFLSPTLGFVTPAAKALLEPTSSGAPVMRVVLNEGDLLLNPPWTWHEVRNHEGFNIGVATRENHPTWIVRNNWLFSALLELRATPRVAKLMIPENQKVIRFMSSIPYLTFTIGYITELIKGPGPHPLFTAAMNPCDEHDPAGCTSTFLDKSVYSDDLEAIPYRE